MADFPPVASLRSFEAVARLGSVTQAAHEMSVTHSAVSQHIKQLEALVGVTLFIRHGRGVRITEEGRLYALQIREALQHIADATRMVQIKPPHPGSDPGDDPPPLAATGCCRGWRAFRRGIRRSRCAC
ncbi:glycine cleavage system transcriptional activator [Klebsiella pneumoniae]|uniref:Glycine cleavage system transcriptional activator n=1 Tax=Klebsiella pneumoniae TaxID=573 RepID=A0A2X3ECV0_KLEPN|nr:glycine cleavage system transcriptional activator [Klebsiella pneumoniae]